MMQCKGMIYAKLRKIDTQFPTCSSVVLSWPTTCAAILRFYLVAPWLLYHSLQALDKGRVFKEWQRRNAFIMLSSLSTKMGCSSNNPTSPVYGNIWQCCMHCNGRCISGGICHSSEAPARRPGFSSSFPWQASCSVGGLTRRSTVALKKHVRSTRARYLGQGLVLC